MKSMMTAFLVLGCLSLAGQNENTSSVNLEDMNDSLSYFLGLSVGYDLQNLPFEANKDLILNGFNGAFTGNTAYDQGSTRAIFSSLQAKMQDKEAAKASAAAEKNLAEGGNFLEKNKKREGVITTESGLQYEVLVEGEGPRPSTDSKVEVHYEGTLIDGKVFDSSYERGESISFPLSGVIPGWTEGLQLMPVGSTYKLYIPANLGYGPQGTGPIPGNSVLIFKVELLGIE